MTELEKIIYDEHIYGCAYFKYEKGNVIRIDPTTIRIEHLHKPDIGGLGSDVSEGGEQLGNEGSATVAARGKCEHECTGPWDCQCQDVIDAFYRGVERKSSDGQLWL